MNASKSDTYKMNRSYSMSSRERQRFSLALEPSLNAQGQITVFKITTYVSYPTEFEFKDPTVLSNLSSNPKEYD